ncbi:MAG: alpha/beta hydrolase [Thermoanaerobaculia bacterium]
MTRRELIGLGLTGAFALRLNAADDPGTARLLARPGGPTGPPPKPGLQELRLERRRDGFLYVPEGYAADRPAPLMVLFHGAGRRATNALGPIQKLADGAGLILLAIDSRGETWDVLEGGYGPDVAFLDRALALVFSRCAVDPARIAAEGFSDGASYALSLGVTNGDLFTHVIAFSPGFLAPKDQRGKPKIFISHGTRDEILSIASTSRRIVPQLRDAGYDPVYREFDGPHTVPENLAREAVTWFTTISAPTP